MADDPDGGERRLNLKDRLVAVGIAVVLITIVVAIFRLGLPLLYG